MESCPNIWKTMTLSYRLNKRIYDNVNKSEKKTLNKIQSFVIFKNLHNSEENILNLIKASF